MTATLADYESAISYLDVLRMEKQKCAAQAIPFDVQIVLDDIASEFDPQIQYVEARITELEVALKAEVTASGEKQVGTTHQVVYYRPSKTITAKDALALAAKWDEEGHSDFAVELRSIITLTKERVSIQPK